MQYLFKIYNKDNDYIERVSPCSSASRVLYKFKETKAGKAFAPVKIEFIRAEEDITKIISKCSQGFRTNDILPEYIKQGLTAPQCSHIRNIVKFVYSGVYTEGCLNPSNQAMIDYIKTNKNGSTMISSIIKAFTNETEYNLSKLREIQKEITKPPQDIPHQEVKNIPFVRNIKDSKDPLDKVIIALYRDMLPIRSGIWDNTYLTDDGNNNFLNIKTNKLLVRKYKTREAYGEQILDIPESIIKLIKKLKKKNKLFNNFKEDVLRVLGKGTNELRHVYVTELINNNIMTDYQLAYGMQTSREMVNDVYYIKEC